MTTSYRLSKVITSVCSGLAAILNAKLLPAATNHVRRITVSNLSADCSVRYSSVAMVCMELQSI